jgi:hypothetical protein
MSEIPLARSSQCQSLMIETQPQDSPETRLPEMTANYFFECCKLGYAANHYKDADTLSARQLYISNADRRHDGLLDLDENSADAFSAWFQNSANFGGHPW